jgi:hypothetical protein
MADKDWIDIVTAVGSIATPILVLAISSVGWKAKKNIEREIELENKLRDDRIDVYNKILEPFIMLLWASDKKNKGKDKAEIATSKMLTLEYRHHGFKLALMANDSVVKAYNNLMQYLYNMEEMRPDKEIDFLNDMMELLGKFLIEIRKSMGNETTSLDHWDMCEWWMTDTRKVKNGTYSS